MNKYPRYYREGKTHKLTDEEVLKAKQMRAIGYILKEIAKELDIAYQTVQYHTDEKINQTRRMEGKIRWINSSKEQKRMWMDRKNEYKKDKWKRQREGMKRYCWVSPEKIIENHPQLKEYIENYEKSKSR